jgi:hypothetical protein
MALIDREWDGFDLESLELVACDQEYKEITTTTIKTFGHSIENYFFENATFASLLRRQIPGNLSAGMLRLIDEEFPGICEFALAYSLAAKKMQIITKLSGLLSRKHIDLKNSHFDLNDEIIGGLAIRGVETGVGENFVGVMRDFQRKIGEKDLELGTIKWASHGHLGSESIWACIAKVLDLSGVPHDACELVERGMKSDKLRHGADAIAAGPHERRPLEWLARWLLGIEEGHLPAQRPRRRNRHRNRTDSFDGRREGPADRQRAGVRQSP